MEYTTVQVLMSPHEADVKKMKKNTFHKFRKLRLLSSYTTTTTVKSNLASGAAYSPSYPYLGARMFARCQDNVFLLLLLLREATSRCSWIQVG